MKSVELLVDEHRKIKRMLKVIRKICLDIFDGTAVPYDDFKKIIGFVRNYADKHHHNKEEEIFFEQMKKELGEPLTSGPLLAMFSEHDLGRLFIKNLEEAIAAVKNGQTDRKIDVIANAIAYTDLLKRHIQKEDDTIYVYGENNLSADSLKKVEKSMNSVEALAKKEGVQEKYIGILEDLENKYL